MARCYACHGQSEPVVVGAGKKVRAEDFVVCKGMGSRTTCLAYCLTGQDSETLWDGKLLELRALLMAKADSRNGSRGSLASTSSYSMTGTRHSAGRSQAGVPSFSLGLRKPGES